MTPGLRSVATVLLSGLLGAGAGFVAGTQFAGEGGRSPTSASPTPGDGTVDAGAPAVTQPGNVGPGPTEISGGPGATAVSATPGGPAPTAAAPGAPSTASRLGPALAVASVAVAAAAVYLGVVSPRRRRRPLRAAARILEGPEPGDEALAEAEALLQEALTAGMRKGDVADARFALAIVRAMLGRYQEAATTVAELHAAGTGTRQPETAYLELWLRAKLEEHDRVCELYERDREAVAGTRQADLIVSISYLRRARDRWRLRQVEGALHYFDLIRALGVLRDQVPASVRSLQLVNGIQAAFDNRLDEARASFASARDRAAEEGEPTVEADLGLVVCDWRASEVPMVDDHLNRLVTEMESSPALVAMASRSAAGASAAEAGVESDRVEPGRVEPDRVEPDRVEPGREELLFAGAALLSAVSLLHDWRIRLAPGAGLPADELAEMERRILRVRRADPDLGDALLVLGLVRYYFARSLPERQAAVSDLELGSGLAKGIQLPEALALLERERKIAEMQDNVRHHLGNLLLEYLRDGAVPLEVRREMKTRFQRFSRWLDLSGVDLTREEHTAEPSLQDIRERSVILRRRVDQLVRPRLQGSPDQDAASQVEDLMKQLDAATNALVAGLSTVRTKERDLMQSTVEFLLPEDGMEPEEAPRPRPGRMRLGGMRR